MALAGGFAEHLRGSGRVDVLQVQVADAVAAGPERVEDVRVATGDVAGVADAVHDLDSAVALLDVPDGYSSDGLLRQDDLHD